MSGQAMSSQSISVCASSGRSSAIGRPAGGRYSPAAPATLRGWAATSAHSQRAARSIISAITRGTDLYFPPIGHWIAQWIAAPGVDPATLVPYSPELYDKAAYANMRSMREPVATLHLYGFFVLAAMIVIHIAAVVITELREGGTLVSAMFTGRKIVSGQPVDAPDPSTKRNP